MPEAPSEWTVPPVETENKSTTPEANDEETFADTEAALGELQGQVDATTGAQTEEVDTSKVGDEGTGDMSMEEEYDDINPENNVSIDEDFNNRNAEMIPRELLVPAEKSSMTPAERRADLRRRAREGDKEAKATLTQMREAYKARANKLNPSEDKTPTPSTSADKVSVKGSRDFEGPLDVTVPEPTEVVQAPPTPDKTEKKVG